MEKRNVAIVIAGGSGKRMGLDIPKQFVNIKGKPVIIYTLEAFEKIPQIDAIEVVCIKGWEDTLRDYLDKFMIAVNNASNLKERELYVVKARAGFFNDREMTLEDIGKEMGVTRERVRQIEIRALWKLRHDENVSSFRY